MNQIYFVSSSGSNSNVGSNEAPWATIQYAIDTITSQTVVQNTDLFIKEGNYTETVALRPFSGPGTINLKAQVNSPTLRAIVQNGSFYSLENISFSNTVTVNSGTLLIKNVKVSTSNSCIVIRDSGVVSTSGTLEVNGNVGSVINCSNNGLITYNSTLIGSGNFTRAFCEVSGGRVTIFNSLSSNSFGGDRIRISGGILTIKTSSSSPVDTLPGSSYGFATGGQIFNETKLIFPTDSTLNSAAASVINAGLITEGTLSDSRLSASVTTQGNVFNGLSQLIKSTTEGKLPPIDGSLLTNITIPIPSASDIVVGTLNNGRLSNDVTLAGNIFNTASSLVKLTSLGKLPAVDGSLLINLPISTTTDASLLSSGTLANARLTSSVTLAGNTFNTSNNLVRLDVLNRLPAVDGSLITNLPAPSVNASDLTSGTLADARLTTNVTLEGNTFNAASKLVKTDSLNRLPAVDGSQLTGLASTTNASLLTSGTLPDARLSSAVTIQGNTFNAANSLVKTDGSNRLPALDGSQLTGLPSGTNASSLSTGTLPDARLSSNVTVQGNTFNGANQLLKIASDGKLPPIDGSNLTNLPGTLESVRAIWQESSTLQTNKKTILDLSSATTLPLPPGLRGDTIEVQTMGSGLVSLTSSNIVPLKYPSTTKLTQITNVPSYLSLICSQPNNWIVQANTNFAGGLLSLYDSYWKLEETTGSRLDSIGTNHLTALNGVGFTTSGFVGGAATFTGNGTTSANQSCLELSGNNSSLKNLNNGFYGSFAIYLNSIPSILAFIVSVYDADAVNGGREFYVGLDAQARLDFTIYDDTLSGTASYIQLVTPSSLIINTWYFVQFWFDRTANTIYLKVNNSNTLQTPILSSFIIRNTAAKLRLGSGYSNFSYGINGRLDSVGISLRVPNQEQINDTYTQRNIDIA